MNGKAGVKTFIIAGLGNPEDAYRHTRHNAGFETINKLGYDLDIPIKKYRRACKAYIGEGKIGQARIVLAKPQTYMNLSGLSVGQLLAFYKLPPSCLIVVCDDTNFRTGDIRVRPGGGAGGHNGLKSIISHLNTEDFIRVRIGVGEKPEGWDLADYVLSRFSKEEWEQMIGGITKAGDAVMHIVNHGVDSAMNTFNRKKPEGDI